MATQVSARWRTGGSFHATTFWGPTPDDPPECGDMLREIGIETSVLPRKAVQEMFPALACDDIVHASWEPEAGYADPSSTVNGMAQAARALGLMG